MFMILADGLIAWFIVARFPKGWKRLLLVVAGGWTVAFLGPLLTSLFAEISAYETASRVIVGLVFNPLVLGVMVWAYQRFFAKLRPTAGDPLTPDSGGPLSKTCPYCAETIKSAAVVCRHCNRNLPPPSSDALAGSGGEPR